METEKRIVLKPHGSMLEIQNDAIPGNRSTIKNTFSITHMFLVYSVALLR